MAVSVPDISSRFACLWLHALTCGMSHVMMGYIHDTVSYEHGTTVVGRVKIQIHLQMNDMEAIIYEAVAHCS